MLNFWRFFIINLIYFIIFTGCSSPKKNEEIRIHSPTLVESEQNKGTVETVLKVNYNIYEKSKKIVFIAGNGMARSFANVGALKEINRNEIELSAIVGNGFGALMGALYLDSENINDFEWKVLKLKNDVFSESFISKKISFSEVQRRTKKINQFLNEIFADKKISDLKSPLYIGYSNISGQYNVIKNNLKIKDALLWAISDGKHFDLRTKQLFFTEQSIGVFARSLSQGIVVYLNSENEKEPSNYLLADFYLQLPLQDIQTSSFDKMNTISYRAERDLKNKMKQIYKKIGIE